LRCSTDLISFLIFFRFSFFPPPVAQARREHAILTELPPHPHIVNLFDVVENSKRLCLVMQYAEGGDLFDYVLKSGKLPQHEAWRIFRQLLDAVNHIHKHGFMHRDIKPENILCVFLLAMLMNVM
jgi:serine/threonine protein kinase